jgi:hypothetical protein
MVLACWANDSHTSILHAVKPSQMSYNATVFFSACFL